VLNQYFKTYEVNVHLSLDPLIHFSLNVEKKRSTELNQEEEVGIESML